MIWFGLLEAAENLFRETVVLPSGWVHQSKKEKWKFLATFYITDLREYYYIWNLICVPLMICLYTFWWPIELMLGDDIWNCTAKITTRPLGNVILKLISELSSMQNVRSILLPCLTIFSNVFIVDVDARPKNTSFVSFTSWSYHYDQLCSRTAYMPASPLYSAFLPRVLQPMFSPWLCHRHTPVLSAHRSWLSIDSQLILGGSAGGTGSVCWVI